MDCEFVYPFVGRKGWGWESPCDIGFCYGPVKEYFLGLLLAPGRVEGVEYCSVVGADVEGDEMVGSIVPGAATCGYC
jgi:hypothetical protein